MTRTGWCSGMSTDQPLSARSKRVDMRPSLDDEVNAAWAEVNKARAERDRLRAALEAIRDAEWPVDEDGITMMPDFPGMAREALDA